MEYIFSSFLFHILFAIVFSIVYYSIDTGNFMFSTSENRQPSYIDFLSLSTSIQSGVGISNISPNTQLSNLLLMVQQALLIATNVFIVYIIFKKKW